MASPRCSRRPAAACLRGRCCRPQLADCLRHARAVGVAARSDPLIARSWPPVIASCVQAAPACYASLHHRSEWFASICCKPFEECMLDDMHACSVLRPTAGAACCSHRPTKWRLCIPAARAATCAHDQRGRCISHVRSCRSRPLLAALIAVPLQVPAAIERAPQHAPLRRAFSVVSGPCPPASRPPAPIPASGRFDACRCGSPTWRCTLPTGAHVALHPQERMLRGSPRTTQLRMPSIRGPWPFRAAIPSAEAGPRRALARVQSTSPPAHAPRGGGRARARPRTPIQRRCSWIAACCAAAPASVCARPL